MSKTAFAKGNQLFRENKLEEAIKEYKKSIKENETFFAYENLGMAFESLGQSKEAAECYDKALKINTKCKRAFKKNKIKVSGNYRIEIDDADHVLDGKDRQAALKTVDRIKRKIFHLGLSEEGVNEFYNFIKGKNKAKRCLCSFELALYYLNQDVKENKDEIVGLLENAKKDNDNYLHDEQIEILLNEAEADKSKRLENIASSGSQQENLLSDNMLFSVANFKENPKDRIEFVNSIYKKYGFLEIELDNNLQSYNGLRVKEKEKIKGINGKELVSIIVPVYNAEGTIDIALASILDQTWSNIEVLVVDDCSTDETKEVIKKFAKIDSRIKILSTDENSGPYVARNVALNVAKGEFVTCNDADDWSHPQKIEIQANFLKQNINVVAASSRQVRATPDLYFHRRGNPGYYIFDNMSSLMFRRKDVLDKLGYWDSVRFGADSEFVKRIKIQFGTEAVRVIKSVPLSFQRQDEGSLTGNKKFGYHGNFFGSRLEYKHSQEYYHSKKGNLKYNFPQLVRPFAIPDVMRPKQKINAQGVRHFDIIIASEYRMNGGSVMSCAEEIKANASLGLTTGIVQLPRFDQNPNDKVLPLIRDLLNNGLAEMIVYGEKVTTDLLIIRYPPCIYKQSDYTPCIEAKNIKVIVNQPPMSDYSTKGEIRYKIKDVEENILKLFNAKPTWHPIGPLVREALEKHHNNEIANINLSDKNWYNIIDEKEWLPTSCKEPEGKLKVGRHARGYKWIKWPETKEKVLACYPDSEEFDIRILGGSSAAEEIIGKKPKNWKVFEYGEITPKEYLKSLDVFVYYTHKDWVESFGRVIIEAMAAGLPVILDPIYKKLFGKYAIYTQPEGVQKEIKSLANNRSYYQQQSSKSLECVKKRFSYEAHRNRVFPYVCHVTKKGVIIPKTLTNINTMKLIDEVDSYNNSTNKELVKLVNSLLASSDQALENEPYSVVDKTTIPPSGDMHDYWHPAPYWWPNPATPDGLPYIRKDGERVPGTKMYEPESNKYDRTRIQCLFDETYILCLSYLFSGKSRYAVKAANNLKVFFVDKETRMNPNLEYSQVKMGHNNNKGSATGLIELKDFYFLVDAFRILDVNGFSYSFTSNLNQWLKKYLAWLTSSRQGLKERRSKNNHGTYYDLQVLSIASYLNDEFVIHDIVKDVESRLFYQIQEDGKLPEELNRRTSAHYCAFTLQGWINLIRTLESCGIKLSAEALNRLENSVKWFSSCNNSGWPYEQIDLFDKDRIKPIISYFGFNDFSQSSVDSTYIVKPVFFPHDGIKPFWNIG